MKNPSLTGALILLGAPAVVLAGQATITINVDRVIGAVDPRIYGVFMEPIGIHRQNLSFHTLYGPVYNPSSPLADAAGFRSDIVEAARELQLTQMRWPGGNFTSGYDWRDGIGPKDKRPKRMELEWGVVETNQVGTDEWIQLNTEIGSENVVCINAGTGTIDDARYWVEYCNAPAGTFWADKRAENGHPEPFAVRYWCLGNEVDGAPWILGHKDADDYVKFAVEAAKVMTKSSPGTKLELIAAGSSNYHDNLDWVEWNWKVIKGLYGIADYLSIHRYWDDSKDYYVFLGQRAEDLDEKISITAGQLKAVAAAKSGKPMYLSIDEWAPPFRGGHLSTLALAEYFNAFIRHADVVKMANYTLLTSILGRDTKSDQTYKSPLFYSFKMYSTRCRGDAVDTAVSCDTFSTGDRYTRIPYLDVSSVYNRATHQIAINIVNRHRDASITADVRSLVGSISASATVIRITSDDIDNRPYTFEARDTYPPKAESVAPVGGSLSIPLPPHSITQILATLEPR
jgi:alpha-N-arabinofuranosidase